MKFIWWTRKNFFQKSADFKKIIFLVRKQQDSCRRTVENIFFRFSSCNSFSGDDPLAEIVKNDLFDNITAISDRLQ